MNLFLVVCIFFQVFISIKADLFTSIPDLEVLVKIEQNLHGLIKNFIDQEQEEYIQEIFNGSLISSKNLTKVQKLQSVTRPLNAYHLVKRLYYARWYLEEDENFSRILETIEKTYGMSLPTLEDFEGAVAGLFRLQDTYNLAAHDLAEGEVYGHDLGQKLNAFDCLEIANVAHSKDDFYHMFLWLNESLSRRKSENPPTALLEDILEYLSIALFEQGNVKRALLAVDRLLKISSLLIFRTKTKIVDPENSYAQEAIERYERVLASEGVSPENMRVDLPPLQNYRTVKDPNVNLHLTYEALCRGDIPRDPKNVSKLFCYYKMDTPYLRLAPFKVEIMHFDPLIVMFREVISDPEIEVIQKLAVPKLTRSHAYDSKTKKMTEVNFRISKSGWLDEFEDEVVVRVNKRIGTMTNLDLETAERLQIANYGIGGHYKMHFDYASSERYYFNKETGLPVGNRIATVLFYMSQPEIGGATVFPNLGLTLWPSKNDAVFWYNLKKNGDIDPRTLHAACPVLLGSKWISNKWIHEGGQEFRRPCGLGINDFEMFVGY